MAVKSDPLAAPSDVAAVRQASREMVRELGLLQAAWMPVGLTTSECHALIQLGDAPGSSAGTLAEALRLDKSTTSRIVARLRRRTWIRVVSDPADARRRVLTLTRTGRARLAEVNAAANRRVARALATLGDEGRRHVGLGLALYAEALARSRRRQSLVLRPIRRSDNSQMASLIRAVMTEFGAVGPGFAISDPEVDRMFESYPRPRARYFVVADGTTIVGGGGYAPLAGGEAGVCELRRMYLVPRVRRVGLGRELLSRAMAGARTDGFTQMYLETLGTMVAARRLYESSGFQPATPLGATGHFGCDAWYFREL
jgi:putative acetyltransferase